MPSALTRRQLLRATCPAALAAAGLLGACAAEPGSGPALGGPSPTARPAAAAAAAEGAAAIVADVLDFALRPDGWAGAFGWVRMRLHHALVDGADVYFVRTDASDAAVASRDGLVFVPKLQPLLNGASGTMITFEDVEQPTLLSSEPGRDDYTPAWTVRAARFAGSAVALASVAEALEAAEAGEVEMEEGRVVVNAGLVRWSDGAMPVDEDLSDYLGGGQVIAAPDTAAMTVTFKLNECYPGSWYFALDHSLEGPANGTNTVYSPGLHATPRDLGATGVTNVIRGGFDGPGPMGGQPSAFDWPAGAAEWSPYWDHFTYEWNEGASVRLLDSMAAVHEARDAGDLTEFVGGPATDGELFTVNCPVPVIGPNLWTPPGT